MLTNAFTLSPIKHKSNNVVGSLPTVPKVFTKATSVEASTGVIVDNPAGTSIGVSVGTSVGTSVGLSVSTSVGNIHKNAITPNKTVGSSVAISTDSFTVKKSTVTGMSTQTDTRMLLSTSKRASRGQSRDAHLELEKRNK